MRQTSERAVFTSCGPNIDFQVLGNAPFSYYKIKYPKKYQSETQGAKIFIFKAFLLNMKGNVWEDIEIQLGKNVMDYKWLTYEELGDYLQVETRKSLMKMLHNDD